MYIASRKTGLLSRVTSGTAKSRHGLVVHTTGGTDSRDWLSGRSKDPDNVNSANALIERDGSIHLLYPSSVITHHAGISEWRIGKSLVYDLNRRFVGLELEQVHDELELCTDAQYRAAAAYHIALHRYWGYTFDSVLGHYQIARPYGRRSDPVGFVWGRFWYHCYAPTFDINALAEDIHTWELTEN